MALRKMMKFEKESAVSTIIATILMVAVTVVLAGVLYVMVIGLGGSNENLAPLGSWSSIEPQSNQTIQITFGSFSDEVQPIDLTLYLYHGSDRDNFTTIKIITPLAGQLSGCIVSGANESEISATYNDYGYESNSVNGGDYLTIEGLEKGERYTVEVYHAPSQSILSMTGDKGTFQMPL